MVWQWLLDRMGLPQDPADLGRWGETQACRFLQKKGFTTIARNWRFGKGELDLVMADGRAIVFVEVKCRTDEDFAPAIVSITANKKRTLLRTAKCFLRKYNISDRPLRFDVVTVVLDDADKPQIRHYRNAFVPK
jgi:putative endonuclease